jgi:hypothetical protein
MLACLTLVYRKGTLERLARAMEAETHIPGSQEPYF